MQILRYKGMDSAREQLQEWVKETAKNSVKSSGIELFSFTTIGFASTLNIDVSLKIHRQIDENASDNELDDNAGQEETDQPSTSG